MANAIELAKSYVPKLDEVYKLAALTSVLDSDGAELKEGANAGEFIIPKMSMDGLGAYDRNNGYAQGSVTMENETVKANFDRGRKFVVDVADDLETAGLAFGKLSAEFIRTMVVPEVDAFRFAAYCGPAVIKAISAACSAMDDAEVPNTDRYLFITPALLQAVKDMDTTKSREVLSDFAGIVKVPQGRFYTAIKQLSGKDSESKGGYTKATGAADLNFMVIHKGALIQYTKHAAPKIITPEYNNDSDGYIFGYRLLSLADVYENKVAGVYASHKPVA